MVTSRQILWTAIAVPLVMFGTFFLPKRDLQATQVVKCPDHYAIQVDDGYLPCEDFDQYYELLEKDTDAAHRLLIRR